MKKHLFLGTLALSLLAWVSPLQAANSPLSVPASQNERLPVNEAEKKAGLGEEAKRSIGRAGMAAALLPYDEESGRPQEIIVVGGANFPQGQPKPETPAAERGEKVFYKDAFIMRSGQPHGTKEMVGELPYEVGYPAFFATKSGMIIAGGCNAQGHLDKVSLLSAKIEKVEKTDDKGKTSMVEQASLVVTELPALPKTLSYPAFAEVEGALYVMGGQENADSTECLGKVYVLYTKDIHVGWQELTDMPSPRMLAAAAVHDRKIYVMGGCSLAPNAEGKAERTYLNSVITYDPDKNEWTEGKIAPMPESMVASPAPLPVIGDKVFVLGGDPGDVHRATLAGNAPAVHPGQSPNIYSYDFSNTSNPAWEKVGECSIGLATAPAVLVMDGDTATALIISGETHPGVRTDAISSILLNPSDVTMQAYGFFHYIGTLVDWTPWAALLIAIAAIFLGFKNGFMNKPLKPFKGQAPGKWAWICVAVLWFVVMLNYFDRQLLSVLNTSVTSPITGIDMTQAQFGFITAVFLVVYAGLSPVGGFLADRFSRKFIILISLVIWSVVTWLTGKAETYEQLLWARAAMGVSEAFYIPAALALISDYHRGSTRSMATGLHMSGIYAGQVLAGYGAMISNAPISLSWQITFEAFGFIGVIYAIIVVLFLRDPEAAKAEELAAAAAEAEAKGEEPTADTSHQFTVMDVLRDLFSSKAMYIMLTLVACVGFANWFIMNWYPKLLQELYLVSESKAGPMATMPINIVKYFAVLVAAVIADRWIRSNPGARAYVPAWAFMLAGPCVLIAMLPSFGIAIPITLTMAIILVSTQGIAQGALDANLMPILRTQIDERFSATGYGMLNLTSVAAGAVVTWLGGHLNDLGIPLGAVLGVAGAIMCVTSLLLFMIGRSSQKQQA